MSTPAARISVVVPTLNEAGWLRATVDAMQSAAAVPPDELIVSDSGSRDGTADLARALGARVLVPRRPLRNRAEACNRGARVAGGDALLFLDADTALPAGWDRAVRDALTDPAVVAGGFELTLDGPEPMLRWVERVNRLRYRVGHLFYGDQALFVRTADFRAVGGFPPLPVLESARLCKRLKGRGRLVLLPLTVSSSARRFQAGGVTRVFLGDVLLWLRALFRLPLGPRAATYWNENRQRPGTAD